MKLRLRHVIPAAFVVALGIALFFALRPREPVYNGRPLSAWLNDLVMGTDGSQRDMAVDAIRHIGPPAVPHLVQLMRARESKFERKLRELLARQKLVRFTYGHQQWQERQYWNPMKAMRAFEALDTNGTSGAAAVIELFDDYYVGHTAAQATQQMGQPVVNHLIAALDSRNPRARAEAAWSLGMLFRADAAPAVPALLNHLRDASPEVRANCAMALARIHSRRKLDSAPVVTALIQQLHDTNSHVRVETAAALGGFNDQAERVLAALDSPARATNRALATAAQKSIEQIRAAQIRAATERLDRRQIE